MDNLFTNIERYKRTMNAPLAARMRPQTLEEYVGQTEAVGPGSVAAHAQSSTTRSPR
jgi:putative ATPase